MAYNIMGKTTQTSVKIYQLTYLVGFCLSFALHVGICWMWPPTGLGVSEEFPEGDIIEGVPEASASASASSIRGEKGEVEEIVQPVSPKALEV